MTKNGSEINCWNCKYIDLSGVYFPGRCTWFKEVKELEPKEIPGDMVDVGCKFFSPNSGQ